MPRRSATVASTSGSSATVARDTQLDPPSRPRALVASAASRDLPTPPRPAKPPSGRGHGGTAGGVGPADGLQVDRHGLVARVDAELVGQQGPAAVEGAHRGTPVGRGGQRAQEGAVGAFDERVRRDQLLGQAHRLGMVAEATVGRDDVLGGPEAQVVELGPGRGQPGGVHSSASRRRSVSTPSPRWCPDAPVTTRAGRDRQRGQQPLRTRARHRDPATPRADRDHVDEADLNSPTVATGRVRPG